MPRECLAHVKYKDGSAIVAVYRLVEGGLFSLAEMRKWIMEDDPTVVEVSISKIPSHLKGPLKKALKSKDA